MRAERAVRRRGNCRRTKEVTSSRDLNSISREYDIYTMIAGAILGVAFGIIFAIGIAG